MTLKLKIREKTLKKIERQRHCWLKVGFLFVPFTTTVILEWDEIILLKNNIWVLLSLIISGIGFIWWFWTMVIIKKLIDYKIIELEILKNTIEEIKSVNNEFKNIK